MKPSKTLRRWAVALAAAGLAALAAAPGIGGAADHLDAPNLSPPGGDTQMDITDVYLFETSGGHLAIVAAVNPAAGVIGSTTFAPDVSYEIHVDQQAALGGEATGRVADLVYRVDFGAPDVDGRQEFRVRRTPAPAGAAVLATGTTGETTELRTGGKVTAGLFDDPFFFDLNGFLASDLTTGDLGFTGSDFFAGLNVTAIVLEVPASEITGGDSEGGVWATTNRSGEQVDRKGRPAINTVFIPTSQKNAFNRDKPRQDEMRYRDEVLASLDAIVGVSPLGDEVLADLLLPDILTIDTSAATGYPNGRGLTDDVIDTSLFLVTGFGGIGDGVDANDAGFLSQFPYLAPAH